MGDNNNKKPIVSDLEKNSKKIISKSNDNKKSQNTNNLVTNNNIKDIKKGISSKKSDNVVNNNKKPTNLANTDLNKVLAVDAKIELVQKNVKQQIKKELKKDNIPVNKDNQQKGPQNLNNKVIVNNNNNNQNKPAVAATGEVLVKTKKPRIRKKWKESDPGYDPAKDTKLQKKLAKAQENGQKQPKNWPQGRNPNYKGKNYDPNYHKKKKQNFNKDNKQQQQQQHKQNQQNNFNNRPYNPFQRDFKNQSNYRPFNNRGFFSPKWKPKLLRFDVYHCIKFRNNPALIEKVCRKGWEALRIHALRFNLLTNRAYFFDKNKFADEIFPRDNRGWNLKQQIENKRIHEEEVPDARLERDWKKPSYFRLKLKNNRKIAKITKNFKNINVFPVRVSDDNNFLTFANALTFGKKKVLIDNKHNRLGSNALVSLTRKFDLPENLSKKVSLIYTKPVIRKTRFKKINKVKKVVNKELPRLRKWKPEFNLLEMGNEYASVVSEKKVFLMPKVVKESLPGLALTRLKKRSGKLKKKLILARRKNTKKFSKEKSVLKFLIKPKTKIIRKKKTTPEFFFPKLIKKEIYQDILTPIQLRKLIRMENLKTKNLNFFARVLNHKAAYKEKGERRPWYDRRWWRYNKKIYDLNVDVSHLYMLRFRNYIFRKVPNLWADTVALLSLLRKGQIDGGAYHDAMITHYSRLYKKHHYGFEQMHRGLAQFLFGRRISVQIWEDPNPIYKDMLEQHEYSAPKDFVNPKNEQQAEALAEKKIRFVKLSSIQDTIVKKYAEENKLTHRSLLRGYGVEVAGRIGARSRGKYFFRFGGNVGRQTTRTRAYGFENASDSLKYGSYGIKLFIRPKDLRFRTRKLHAKMSRIIALRDEFITRNVKKLYRFTFVKKIKAINQNAIKGAAKYKEILVKNASENILSENNKNYLTDKKNSAKLKRVSLLKKNSDKYFTSLGKKKIKKKLGQQQLKKKKKVVKKKAKSKKVKLKKISKRVKKRFKFFKKTKPYSFIMKQFIKKARKNIKIRLAKQNKKQNKNNKNKNKNKNRNRNKKINNYDKRTKK